MSTVYNLEPQPTASCILHTTSGDISLELFAHQTPLTSRNFLQLALDGYYDNTLFHRLIPGFILQGGDPSGTGSGGESIYDGGAFGEPMEEGGIWPMEERAGKNVGPTGVGFRDEFHSRLKFNRRGLLGMANEGRDSNGSQFFITLGETPELQGKNTMFGRVAGDTIYNVAKMGEAETEGERPVYPTRVMGVEVLVNPFKDMVPRRRTVEVRERPKVEKPKGKKRKGGKTLLSFGGEEGEGEEASVKKAKFDTRIVVDVEGEPPKPQAQTAKQEKKADKKPEKAIKKAISVESSPEPSPPKPLPTRQSKPETREISSSPDPEPVQKVSSLLERTNAQIAELKASMKRNVHVAPEITKKKSALEEMIPQTSIRGRKRRAGGQSGSSRDDQAALDILRKFREKLEHAPEEKEVSTATPAPDAADKGKDGGAGVGADDAADDEEAALCDLHFIANCQSCKSWDVHGVEAEADDDDKGWMSHALSFKADKLGKDLSYRKKAEEELVVIDPREKARTLKEEVKAKRQAREGGSGREWDSVRNEKLARQAGAAGRGAR
jgi:peptidyl-prolyl cis-trans isomerase SDCCAG10